MLAGTVANAVEVTVQPRDPRHRFFGRFDRLEAQDVAEETAVGVLVAPRRRVQIEVALNQARALQDAGDVARARADLPGDLADVGCAGAVQFENAILL